MLFARNAQDPIYNSLSDLKSNTPINEWFNLSVYDESTLSQTAQEIESMLKKILPTINKGITLVLFQDEDEKAEFEAVLNSPTVIPIILKLEGDGRSLLLHTISDFEKMLQEFKSV